MKKVRKTIFYIIITVAAILMLLPLVLLFSSAVRSTPEFFANLNLLSWPKHFEWSNFAKAWTKGHLGRYMLNGLLVCCIKVPLGIIISSMCAYALTRFSLKGSNAIFIYILVGMMLPWQMALIPINIMATRTHLTNTYVGLILVYLGFGVPLGTLVFRGFFKSIPREIDEAAKIDGCGSFRLYTDVIMPIARPATATMLILDFLHTWNEFLLQTIIITNDSMKTVPNGIVRFMGEYSTDYGLLSAGVLISIIPVFIIYLIFQKQFVEGMAGAVKA